MRVRRWLEVGILVITFTSIACDDETAEPQPAAVEAARVTVHEWGLVAYHYTQGPTEMAEIVSGGARYAHEPAFVGLGLHSTGRSGGKPVIYVHTTAETELSVRVRAPGGMIVEHLPPASSARPDSIEWSGLTVSPGTCPTSTRVTPEQPACATVDRYCEALENPDYDTADASCLTSRGGARDNHLFYRAGVQVGGLPLVVSKPNPGESRWDARNASTTAISGKLMVVWRPGDGAPPHVALVDPPAPGATITLPADGPALEPEACVTTLRRMLTDNGLTSHETDAFMRAWDASIFGYIDDPGPLPPHQTPPAELRQTPHALYYFAPREAVERVLPLEVTPAPAELARAMLVKVNLHDAPPLIDTGSTGSTGSTGLGNVGTIGLGNLGTIGHGQPASP